MSLNLDASGSRSETPDLKEEALDRIKWMNRFGRDCGPVVWQITDEWMNYASTAVENTHSLNISYKKIIALQLGIFMSQSLHQVHFKTMQYELHIQHCI
jgi:hypothetical protein